METLQIPQRDTDQSRKADRVQSSTGSWNVCWRREPPGGNTEEPEADRLVVQILEVVERGAFPEPEADRLVA